MDTVATRIMQIVDSIGGNKSEFARRINVTPAYISKLSKEPERAPSERTLQDICREFKVSYQWLTTGEGEMFDDISDSALDALAATHGLNESDKKVIASYLALNHDEREAVKKWIYGAIRE